MMRLRTDTEAIVLSGNIYGRCKDLGYTEEDLAAASGLSLATIKKLHVGRRGTTLAPSTIRKLETALSWRRGSVEKFLADYSHEPEVEMPKKNILNAIGKATLDINRYIDAAWAKGENDLASKYIDVTEDLVEAIKKLQALGWQETPVDQG